ncbi:class F sortase [Janibacter anophelis]|uniref:class F sortase n=1 Tax=Janibacter anophelis TaxID=319054 RepID=UPI003F7E0215
MSDPTPDSTRTASVAPIPDDASTSTAPTSPASSPGLVMSPERMGPDRIYVPSLGIYASLTSVRFSGGSLTIPREPWRVGLDIDSAPVTASSGTTLLAGHVDLSGTPGALVRLADAEPGALVYVTDDAGERSSFVTSGLQRYSKVSLPRSIFAVDGPRQLVLVTCGGPVITVGGERHYRDNVVLTAVPTT